MSSPGPDSVSPNCETAPSIYRDRSFWGLTISQFLGAFNDNLFKQLVLLLCLDYSRQAAIAEGLKPSLAGDRYSFWALVAFAVPWLLLSGFAGALADRTSKRTGIILFKAAEGVVMLAGLAAFLSGHLWPLLLAAVAFALRLLVRTRGNDPGGRISTFRGVSLVLTAGLALAAATPDAARAALRPQGAAEAETSEEEFRPRVGLPTWARVGFHQPRVGIHQPRVGIHQPRGMIF